MNDETGALDRRAVDWCLHAWNPSGVAQIKDVEVTRCSGMRALVVGCDPEMLAVFSQLFREIHVETYRCMHESELAQLLSRQFEAIVLDFHPEFCVAGIRQQLKATHQNERAVVFAVASQDETKDTDLALGVDIVVNRPFVPSVLRQILRGAHGRMLRDSQAYFRVTVALPVSITRSVSGSRLQCTSINLSRNGVAEVTPYALKVGERVSIAFCIPGTSVLLTAEGTVIGDDKRGTTGINFECMNWLMQARLLDWLHEQFFNHFFQTQLPEAESVSQLLSPMDASHF